MEAKAKAQTLLNCCYAVELGKKLNLVLVGIEGNDIMTGNKMLTLALSTFEKVLIWSNCYTYKKYIFAFYKVHILIINF